jgi:GNAT superfamily N-acetyltransferase
MIGRIGRRLLLMTFRAIVFRLSAGCAGPWSTRNGRWTYRPKPLTIDCNGNTQIALMQTKRLPIFRPAVHEDQDFIYGLVKASLPDVIGMPVPDWSRDDFHQSWERGTKMIITFDGARAGYLRWEHDPDALHLADLQVVPAFRRQGVEPKTVIYFERQAAAEGFTKVSLVVHDANNAAGPSTRNSVTAAKHEIADVA